VAAREAEAHAVAAGSSRPAWLPAPPVGCPLPAAAATRRVCKPAGGCREQGEPGDYAAAGISSTSRAMSGSQHLKIGPNSPLSVFTRVCNTTCAPGLAHCLCCFLPKRLLTTSCPVDSPQPVAIASLWCYRCPSSGITGRLFPIDVRHAESALPN